MFGASSNHVLLFVKNKCITIKVSIRAKISMQKFIHRIIFYIFTKHCHKNSKPESLSTDIDNVLAGFFGTECIMHLHSGAQNSI